MKNLLLFLTFSLLVNTGLSQNNVGIKSDGSLPDSSAKLDIQSTTQGLLLPRMTTALRNSMPKKTAGLIVYDTDKQTLYLFNGMTWNPLAAVTNNELQPFLTGSNPGSAYESFGCSVAIYGDWAAVGAYGYDLPGKQDCGAVYIYKRIDGIWQQIQIINATDAAAGDRFGYSVAIDGDRLITGAYLANKGSLTYCGAAYIFHNISNIWIQQIKLQPGDVAAGDYFGYSVAIEGNNAIVGAPGDDITALDQGSSYLYRFESFIPGWVFDIKLNLSSPSGNEKMGTSVGLSGIYAAVGVPGGNSNTGFVLIYNKNTGWQNVNSISGYASANSQFGTSLCLKNNTIVIGAPFETVNGLVARGKVYSFYFAGGWQYNGDILLPTLAAGDRFGSSVAFSNGYIIAGATQRTVNGNISQGEVYVFKQNGTWPSTVYWDYKRKINAPNGSASEYWGQCVAVSGFNIVTGTEWPLSNRGKVIFLNVEE